MNKGIVMELSESTIIVMSPEGRFEKLPRGTRNCEVGEEILFAPVKKRARAPQLAIASGLAAAILLCFVLVSTLTGTVPSGQVVAYVSIDINPSVELGIDNKELVQDLRGLNTDGEALIQTLDYKGKPLTDVTSQILDQAEQGALGTGEGDIIISSTIVEEQASVNDEAIATKLKEQVSKHIEEAHPDQASNYEVTAFAAPQEIRQEAKSSGVSAGKYAIYLNALDNGAKVSLDDIKSLSIHQLAKDNGGIDKLVKPEKPISKTSLKQLVEDEKSGKLNERFQKLAKEREDKDSKDKNSNSKAGDKNNSGKNGNDKNAVNGKSVTTKPVKTPTPKNDKNNDSNNNKNNGRNDSDDRKSTKKPDDRDDNNRDPRKDSSAKPGATSSAKPTIKPAQPSVKPSPTPKTGAGNGSRSKDDDSNKNDDNRGGKQDNRGKESDKDDKDSKDNSDNKGKNNRSGKDDDKSDDNRR